MDKQEFREFKRRLYFHNVDRENNKYINAFCQSKVSIRQLINEDEEK
jgi:hypothetical protein